MICKARPPLGQPDPPAANDFRPLPLLRNPHVQTLLAHVLRGRTPRLAAQEHVVRLPDGDAMVLHDTAPPGWRPGGPVAVLVHGLTGRHASAQIVRLAAALLARGLRVVRTDLRGAGKALPLSR